jgi:AmmeMemoRadiSam system protein A
VVGYGSWALFEPPAAGHRPAAAGETEDAIAAAGPELLALARRAVTAAAAGEAPPAPLADLPPALAAAGAAFVTLTRRGELRGCIGSAAAWRPLAEDVLENAYKSALADPRFPPLSADELDGLEIFISVLSPPEPISARDEAELLAALRPGEDGLIIEDGGRRALFLPSVWEHLGEPRQFLAHLKLKAGLPADHWSPDFAARRFRTVQVAEVP